MVESAKKSIRRRRTHSASTASGKGADAAAQRAVEKGSVDMGAKDETTATQVAEQQASNLVVRADEEPWTAAELEEVYRELEAEANRLALELDLAESELADLLRDATGGAGEDQVDAGAKTFEREHELSLANNTRHLLIQTQRAMVRIRDGSYGVCEGCGNPIGKARLLAFPRATLCMSCKKAEERR